VFAKENLGTPLSPFLCIYSTKQKPARVSYLLSPGVPGLKSGTLSHPDPRADEGEHFVEIEGREGNVTIQLPHRVRATETTLLEDVVVGPVGEGTIVKFHMNPWEIKILRLSRPQ
jgi:hypothetical protein